MEVQESRKKGIGLQRSNGSLRAARKVRKLDMDGETRNGRNAPVQGEPCVIIVKQGEAVGLLMT